MVTVLSSSVIVTVVVFPALLVVIDAIPFPSAPLVPASPLSEVLPPTNVTVVLSSLVKTRSSPVNAAEVILGQVNLSHVIQYVFLMAQSSLEIINLLELSGAISSVKS